MRKPAAIVPAVGLVLLATPLGAAVAAPSATPTCAAQACTVTYPAIHSPQTFTVPTGVTALKVTVAAGSGGAGHPTATTTPAAPGGTGGLVIASVPVTPGERLTAVAGSRGADATETTGLDAAGGYGGGGAGKAVEGGSDGAGGGGSFLFRGATVLIASGGGGGGGYAFPGGGPGGAGGAGGAAGPGTQGEPTDPGAGGGGGATSSKPGAAGIGGGTAGSGPAAGPSTFGTGGTSTSSCPGGGGGGGYFGGGSGGCGALPLVATARPAAAFAPRASIVDFGGGGGGSGLLAHSVTALSRSTNTGDGRVVIQYVLPAPTQTTLTVAPTSTPVGTTVTLTAKVSSTAGTPGGQVVFTEGSVTLGKAAAVNGVATLEINAGQTVGTRSFTARYLGAPTFAVSSSSAATLSVTAPPVTSQAVDAELANTGNGTGLQVALALGALGFGAAVLYLARRRSPLKSRG